jgi:dynactin complex subunit
LKRTYDEKMKLYKDAANDEVVRLKQQMVKKEADLKTEWEVKLQLVIDSQTAEKEKSIQEISQKFKKEISELKQQ